MLNIKNFLKRKKMFKKNNVQPNPNIYWMVIFYTGFFLTILSFTLGFYSFSKINKEESLTPAVDNTELQKISKKRIDKVLNVFEVRKEASNQIINFSAPVVDPSL
jgi:outer membrane lipoprotein-sorting protein